MLRCRVIHFNVTVVSARRRAAILSFWSSSYKAQLVEGSGNGYLRTVGDYAHLNPVRAKLLAPDDRLLAYP